MKERGKESRKQYYPQVWISFLASGPATEKVARAREKGQRVTVDPQKRRQVQREKSEGEQCWEVGRKLGLNSKLSDELIA